MDAIRTVALTKKYQDKTVVDALDLSVREGELFALLGVNGAGKSTTIRMLTGLLSPTSGDAFLLGHSLTKETQTVKTFLAVSPQETAVAPGLNVRENLALICGVHGFSADETARRIAETVEALSLSDVLTKKAGKLSGGWQRRLSIAMALIVSPKILFLDEPTLGLDVIARSELWDFLRTLKGKTTIVLTTHYMEEAEALSDRVGILCDGRLLNVGTVDEIKTATGSEKFEDAFIRVVKEGSR